MSLVNARIRREGTRNLLEALENLPQTKIVAQSVAWTMRPGPEADAVAWLEDAVLAVNGVILRYGFFYGPGTYFDGDLPPAPRVHIDSRRRRLSMPSANPPASSRWSTHRAPTTVLDEQEPAISDRCRR